MAEIFDINSKQKSDNVTREGFAGHTPGQNGEDSRHYSSDEVSDIIRIALQDVGAGPDNTVGHEELLSIAYEFGLQEQHIDSAFEKLHHKRQMGKKEAELWSKFKAHGLIFVCISLLLAGFDAMLGPEYSWSAMVIFSWAAVVVLHGLLLRFVPELVQAAFEKAALAAKFHYSSDAEIETASAFTIPDLFMGLADAHGIINLEKDILLIEYKTEDTVLGLFDTGIREKKIPYTELLGVQLEKQFWNTKLILQASRMKSFRNIPGQSGGRITLTFNSRSRSAVVRLAEEIRQRIAEANR